MCKCTPNIRTPFCGKIGCEWPKDEVDLGDGHRLIFSDFEGQRHVGAMIEHRRPGDGMDCGGWLPFADRAWAEPFGDRIETWKVEQDEPITLSPSVKCRLCGDHGYVRNGRWEKA